MTSLPGGLGIGDLGKSAYEFVDFLAQAGEKIWQVLPLGPTGYGDSPYQLFSAFAGNPLLIDPEELRRRGWLSAQDLADAASFSDEYVDYGRVIEVKQELLRKAAETFLAKCNSMDRQSFESFCENNSAWLDDYALFMACKAEYKNAVWSEWPRGIRKREAGAIAECRGRLKSQIAAHKFAQFEFSRQWRALKDYANGEVPHLIILLDSIPFEAVADRYERGQFRYFDSPRKLIGTFPSLTEQIFTRILHAPPLPGM